MFSDLERFAQSHRRCGDLTTEMCDVLQAGYLVLVECCCGATFEQLVSPDIAGDDPLRGAVALDAEPVAR